MAVAVPERTGAGVSFSNGRMRVWVVRDDPAMTRAARAARTAWRLEHLAEWRAGIQGLDHYEPGYPYDIAHEYGPEWTTDPDYGSSGVHLFEFDEDGVLTSPDKRPQAIELYMRDTAEDLVGRRVVYQSQYGFDKEIAVRLKRYTAQGDPANFVKPDLLVMPSEADLDPALIPADRQPRPDDAVPELILEILSKSTAAKDLNDKRLLYEMLGVHEYLVYDLGGKRWDGSPRELLLFRIDAAGVYRDVPADPGLSEPEVQVYWSNVFNAHIRFRPDAQEWREDFRDLPDEVQPPPCFQWYDPTEGRWRDRASDREYEQKLLLQEREARGEARVAVLVMRDLLGDSLASADLDRVEQHWFRTGPPTDLMVAVRSVQEAPREWRSLLGISPDSDDAREPDNPISEGGR